MYLSLDESPLVVWSVVLSLIISFLLGITFIYLFFIFIGVITNNMKNKAQHIKKYSSNRVNILLYSKFE